ncbi:DnaD domain-containing protein [Enterococcus sp. JM9B]|uniref:DnaD domain-containing protein n=1 Tax=Enterococcus sp. JM9B TaxID=1857216 RepID=UPI0013750856|nr:DnaD domain-containing protein [Enterococcus sp. JM9B]KAF1301187.1 DNA replication protein DnaD [Enterococcus sp. JM9B]
MISLKDYLESGQTTLANLILANYRRIGMTNEEFLFWLQLYRHHQMGNDFPDLSIVADDLQMKQPEILLLLNQLVKKQFLTIETITDVYGKKNDRYNFELIFDKLEQLMTQQLQQTVNQEKEDKVTTLYRTFEEEFGRTLSPIQYQRIGQWLEEDHYSPELILLALKEAVLNQKYNFNYIDSILLSWEKNQINTKEQVDAERKRRKRQQMQKEPTATKQLPKVSLHNWLDGDD